MAEGALNDVVVLELATGVAGPYCGRLLSDLGAQVIKLEPPGGDACRGERPLVGGESAFFNWLNAGKFGVQAEPGSARLAELAGHADIVLHSARGAEADAIDAVVTAANPHAVVISLTPYGRSGPRSGWQASDLTEYATSGYGYIGGDAAREPLSLPGHQAEFHAGLHAGTAALAGLWHARETGEGQLIEISHQEATLIDHAWLTTIWTHTGAIQRRTGSIFAPCADGFVYLFNLVPYPNLFIMIERFDLLEDESLLIPQNWWARFGEIFAAFKLWAADKTKQEIYHLSQELRVVVSPVNDMADVVSNPQLAAREWFANVTAGGESFTAPGFPYRMMGTPCASQGPAPQVGEHTAVIGAPGFTWANADVDYPAPSPAPAENKGPLAGLRVIEVTANWAGPIGGRHLGDLGADVIKVELATKPATRTLVWIPDDTWPDHYHRSGYFNKLNRNKRAICLDLASPEGKAVFLRLVAEADVVLENNSARVMGNLGLAYADLAAVNPDIVMCSMTGYGSTGPERNYAAYGSNIETASGLASLMGYGPGEFYGTGSYYADPVTGNHGSVAILAALHARRHTGRGQWLDVSLLEAVTPFFAQSLLEYTTTGEVPVPRGNRSLVYSPQGNYPTMGKDCWLSLTVRDGNDWVALCGVIGRVDLRGEPSLATAAGRRSRESEIDAAIGTWAAGRNHIQAAEALQAVGVPAAPVMPNWEVASDNHLHSRGFFLSIAHPVAGTHLWPGYPWRFARTPASISRPAPLFAEHNAEVFRGLLGLSEDEVAALYASGATADAPAFADGRIF